MHEGIIIGAIGVILLIAVVLTIKVRKRKK
jgi:hypothetical protein